jgi:ABC-type uncharacterized transport system substrate-binding protein
MRRRDLLGLLGGAAVACPLATGAQQKPMPVIGLLSSVSPPKNLDNLIQGPIHQGLAETGYVDGQNMAFEYRWAEGHYDRLPALAADLASRKVDVIVAASGGPSATAARSATSTIPIVFIGVGDAVGIGLVAGLAHPGGNVTGFSNISVDLMPKQLELLSELFPQAGVTGLLLNPNSAVAAAERIIRELQEAVRVKGLKLAVLKAGTEREIDAAFASLVELQPAALVVDPDAFLFSRREQLVALASRYAVPAIYGHRAFVAAGGLISYAIDYETVSRQAGVYAGRILKGEKPANMPVQQPTKFELVINLKTANALGLTVPQSLLARADEVIE